MKSTFKKTSLALAVAALFASPLAFAEVTNGESGIHDFKLTAAANLSLDVSTTQNYTKVEINKELNYEQDVEVAGKVNVRGDIFIDASSAAIVDDKQINYLNNVNNNEVTNSATVNGNALNNAKGNIGVNVTAGDNNQQANAAALSAADASFVFGSSDAEIFARQDAQGNHTRNYGNTNSASLGGNALQNASGNIGVNISAGNSNQQKNDLAASVAVARMATATVAVKQMNDHNSTSNDPIKREEVQRVRVDLALNASGGYNGNGSGSYSGGSTSGTSDQIGNVYPDTWSGSSHPGGSSTGHFDLDTATQGGSDLNGDGGALAFGERGNYSGGSLGFSEAGGISLSGSVTGYIPVVVAVNLATTNTSSLGDNALMNASGNIGVNIASGTNNQQFNGMAVSATQAGRGNGGE